MKTKIITYLLLLLFLCLGIYLRTNNISESMGGNTVAFFYARARDLQINNQYPLEDRLNYAPEVFKEDYPPFPAYFAVVSYRIIRIFLDISFYSFILFFPIIIYILMFISGFFLMNNVYGRLTGFFFAALLTIMPSAAILTKKGYYTEEALGVFLILLFFFFYIKSEKKKIYFYLSIITLTLLNLTWQIFMFVIGGIFLSLLIYRKRILKHITILIIPLLLGHVISVYIIGLDYSPIYMFKETYIGYKYESTEEFQIAFHREKLKHMDIQRYTEEYSYLGLIFLIPGLFICIKNIKKYDYGTLLIYSILSFFAINKYIKFRFFSLIFILILSSLGMESIYNLDIFTKLKLGKYFKKYWKIPFIILLILLGLLIIRHIQNPECESNLILPEKNLEIGKTYSITLQIKNTGKGALCSKTAFSGLHIEVENAIITEKKAYSSTTTAKVIEKEYTINNIDWFEAKFDCLKHNELGRITFSLKPYAKPVKINYRCWIPQFCLRSAPKNILPDYKQSWRNEKCLYREPSEGELCAVPVYAGYAEKQDYYCRSVILP